LSGCFYEEVECDDYDPCTKDFCDPVSGCNFITPACLCDDDNACTDDSCLPNFGCVNVEINCDDNNEATVDSCDQAYGCVYLDQEKGY